MSIAVNPRDAKCEYCGNHYTRSGLLRHTTNNHTGKKAACIECDKPHEAKGYCIKHYAQVRKWGEVRKTRFDNPPVVYEDRIEYIVKGKKVIFDRDFETPKGVPSLTSHGYITFVVDGKQVYAHRLVVNAPKGYEVDHINHNHLDNRKSNLRIVTPKENGYNRPVSVNNKSGYLGVYKSTKNGKWTGQVQRNRKKYTTGYYEKLIDAVKARNELALKIHGEFANTEGYRA